MAYNNNTNETPNQEGERNIWQRQQDVLAAITAAEKQIADGENFQNPIYDEQFGIRRNMVSVVTIHKGCEQVLKVIAPNFKEKEERTIDNPKKPGEKLVKEVTIKGIQTQKFELYTQALSKAQDKINESNQFKLGTTNSNFYLQQAYDILKNIQYCLREDVSELGYDFKAEPSVYDAWMH
jgi:hypothetical protein